MTAARAENEGTGRRAEGSSSLRRSMPKLLLYPLAVVLALQAGLSAAPGGAASARPVQRLERSTGASTARLEAKHFDVVYDPARLTAAQVEKARAEAEEAWSRCESLFGTAPVTRLRLDLTPDFKGATGFARPGNPNAADPEARPMVGVRYADLEYLGLSGEYVLTHEVGHIFSGRLAGSSLGEGIADWAAGGFAGVSMRPGWGKALEEAGLWVEPEAFFVTGEFGARPEVDAVIRTAQYTESALLVKYLADRFGWARTRDFAEAYGKLRGRLNSNEDRKRIRLRGPLPEGQADPRQPPDAPGIRALFEKQFGASWSDLRGDWERSMAADRVPAAEAQRLVLGERIYGAIRGYEMWLLAQRSTPDRAADEAVRAAFAAANRAVRLGYFSAATRSLQEAEARVEQLRRPQIVA